MKKRRLPLLPLFYIAFSVLLIACGNSKTEKGNGGLPIYIPYDEIPEDYSQETAKADGCVVVESESACGHSFQYAKNIIRDGTPISGGEIWNNFLEAVENGETVKIRVVYFFVPPVVEGKALWEHETVRIFDLSYDDGKYFLHYKKDGKEITQKYAMLKCFEGDYYKKEWILLKEDFLDAEYKEIMKVSPFSSWITINTDSYHLIYFSDDEAEISPTPIPSVPLASFAPTQLYAAATYALAVDENGNASYLYTKHNTDGSDMNYPDFKQYLCAGIAEDSHGPCIITQDLKKRVGGMTSKEWEALLDDSLLSGETVGEGICSAVERLKQQETWQDVCQMICVWGDWYAALRTDGTVFSLGCFEPYETVEEDWCDIVQIVSGGEALFGLKSDGTVYAHLKMNPMVYGKTREEEIREWSDIVQIAGGNSVVGLRKDGTVVTVKGGIFRECQEWSNITKIAASRYAIVGIQEDGTVIAKCSKQCGFTEEELAGWNEIEQIAVCDDYCIAVGKDKTVYRTGQKE